MAPRTTMSTLTLVSSLVLAAWSASTTALPSDPPRVTTIAVTPIQGPDYRDIAGSVYKTTRRVILSLRAAGFNAGAIAQRDDPVPGQDPYVLLAGNALDHSVCIRATATVMRLPTAPALKFTLEIERRDDESAADDRCVVRLVEALKQRLKQAGL